MFAARTTIGLPLVNASRLGHQRAAENGVQLFAPLDRLPKLDSSISVVVDWMSFRYCTISS